MRAFGIIVIVLGMLAGAAVFVRLLTQGSDGAWLALGVGGTLGIYLLMSAVRIVEDGMRTRWLERDSRHNSVQQHLQELRAVAGAQGQALLNQQRVNRLGPGADDVLNYDDILTGDVLELPAGVDDEIAG